MYTTLFTFTYISNVLGGTRIREFDDRFNGYGYYDCCGYYGYYDHYGYYDYYGDCEHYTWSCCTCCSCSAPKPAGETPEEPVVAATRAIILNAFEDIPYRRDYYPLVKSDWDDKGLETTIDIDVTVNDIKNLQGYSVIVFSGHGDLYNTIPAWCLNEVVTADTDKTYENDLLLGRIAKVNGGYYVLPSLIENAYAAEAFKDSLLFSESCMFMGIDDNVVETFADAWISRSIKAVIGFHNSVLADYSRDFMKTCIDNFIDGKTAQESFDTAVSVHGVDDGGLPPAYPLLRGNMVSVIK